MAQNESSLVPVLALASNVIIAVAKFGAAFLTGSAAMMSEAIHSTVDCGNEVLLLTGMHLGRRPPDASHPFGYGMEVYFWSMLMAVMLFGLGAGASLLEGIREIAHPEPITDPLISYGVLALAVLAEGTSWAFSARALRRSQPGKSLFAAVRRSKNPAIFAVIFEDSAALLGIAAAALGIGLSQITGAAFWDGVGAVVIAFLLLAAGLLLARECRGLLTGEAALPELREDIEKTVRNWPGVLGLGELATLQIGPEAVLVTLSLDFEPRLNSDDVELAVSGIEENLKGRHKEIARLFVEAQSIEQPKRSSRSGGAQLSSSLSQ